MHWQEIAAIAIVGMTVALFVRGFLKRTPSACGRGCACPAASETLRTNGTPAGNGQNNVSKS
jgi:hypothetical protein